jgi:UDP-N-acetylmuramate--alanine ligase
MEFTVMEEGIDRGPYRVPVPGLHNLRNALGATAAARFFGVDWDAIREGLASYQGVARRFDIVGRVGQILVVDDYAHHPSEITATLAAARAAHPDRRIVAVFQPHLFTRTRDFAEDFGRALTAADVVWVTDIFPAREDPIPGVTGELVALAADRCGATVHYHVGIDTLPEVVVEELAAGDLFVTMGAGSVDGVARRVITLLEGRNLA